MLLVDKRLTPAQWMNNNTSSEWDFSRLPEHTLCQHNRDKRFKLGPRFPKSTKALAPNWQIAILVGPFKQNAAAFMRAVKARSRKFKHHISRCVMLAEAWPELDPAQKGEPVRIRAQYSEVVERIMEEASMVTIDEKLVAAAKHALLPS